MKTLVIANWKCNPTTAKEAKQLFDAVKRGLRLRQGFGGRSKSKNAEVVICPPFLYLPLLKGMTLGAQDVFYEEKGAFTGEVSVLMLKDLNVEYVIVGHSERRKYFNETDEMINKKNKKALIAGLKVIFCVGETEEQKNAGKIQEVLKKQLEGGLAGVSNVNGQISNVVIAYEPVWAIGTGKNCSIEDTISAVELIKNNISKLYSRELADGMRILYGGSVNSNNCAEYIKNGGVNGLLVGGASLNAEEFIEIVKFAR